MGGGPTTTYTVSSATSVAANSMVWVVIQPTPASGWTPASTGGYTLKVYVQASAPTSTDTPIVSEPIAAGTIDQLRVFKRATNGIVDDLKIECIPLSVMDTSAWSRKTPIPWLGGSYGNALSVHPTPTTSRTAQAYLGTDDVYTNKEDS